MGKWTFSTSLLVLTLYKRREVRDVPVLLCKGLYPTTPVWWVQAKVPRGMAAQGPQMVALQGRLLMGDPLRGPYHLMLAPLWSVEVVHVFVRSILHQGHPWRLPRAIRSAFADLTTEHLFSADRSFRPLFEASLELRRLNEERATAAGLE